MQKHGLFHKPAIKLACSFGVSRTSGGAQKASVAKPRSRGPAQFPRGSATRPRDLKGEPARRLEANMFNVKEFTQHSNAP